MLMFGICRIICILLLICTTAKAESDYIKLNYTPPYKDLISDDYSLNNLPLLKHFDYDWGRIPGAVELELVGTHKIVGSYLQRRFRRHARERLINYYNDSEMTLTTLHQELSEINSEWSPYGDWWDRPWFFSLPPEKGGVPRSPQKKLVGFDLTIPPNFPVLHWLKERFEAIGDIWIDDERAYINTRDKDAGQGYQTKIPNNLGNELKEPINVVFEGEGYSWYDGTNYHLRFRPSLRMRPGNTAKEIFGEYSLKILVEIFVQNHTIHFADLVLDFSHDIANDSMVGSVALILLVW